MEVGKAARHASTAPVLAAAHNRQAAKRSPTHQEARRTPATSCSLLRRRIGDASRISVPKAHRTRNTAPVRCQSLQPVMKEPAPCQLYPPLGEQLADGVCVFQPLWSRRALPKLGARRKLHTECRPLTEC